MPNLYERTLAIPDSTPGAFSGALPAGSVAGYAPAIPSGQILVWNVSSGAWTKETHAPGVSVQVKVTQGDMAGWYILQPSGSAFARL